VINGGHNADAIDGGQQREDFLRFVRPQVGAIDVVNQQTQAAYGTLRTSQRLPDELQLLQVIRELASRSQYLVADLVQHL